MGSTINALILYADYSSRASYYNDWIDAFQKSKIYSANALNICNSGIKQRLCDAARDVDAIILLHSTNADQLFYLEPIVPILANSKAKILSFVGNEVNLPGAPISDKRKLLKKLRPDFIATQLLKEAGDYLWGDIATVISVPHALNPDSFSNKVELHKRKYDLAVRSYRYPVHIGDNDRNRLMDYFQLHASDIGLKVDIGEGRLDRQGWAELLNNTRGTLATEAGSWYLSKEDDLIRQIQDYLQSQKRGGITLSANNKYTRRLVHKFPWWLRQLILSILKSGPIRYESTLANEQSYDEIYEKYFKDRARAPVYTKCISSRHFDAMGTGTAMLMFQGRYNDILVPDVHYFAIEHDFSNIDEAIERFMDPREIKLVTQASLELAHDKHTYAKRVQEVASVLER